MIYSGIIEDEVKVSASDYNSIIENSAVESYYLAPTKQKSYYRKAKVYVLSNGRKFLKSYDKFVCVITEDGEFRKWWNGFSVTTLNHVNDFRKENGLEPLRKAEWNALPCRFTQDRYSVTLVSVFSENIKNKLGTEWDNEEDARKFALPYIRDGRFKAIINKIN